jgi:hypothetical protein
MNYVIGIGGLFGVYMLAFSLFNGEHFSRDWKRWALGLTGAALVILLLIVRPVLWQAGGETEECGSGRYTWEC